MPTISTTEILAVVSLETIQRRYGFNLQECLIDWALSEMQRGVESISLYVLAGMSPFDSPFEVEAYFKKALRELKIKFPVELTNKTQAIRNYVSFICNKVLCDELSEIECCAILSDICVALDYSAEYSIWHRLNEERYLDLISEAHFKQAIIYQAKHFVRTLKITQRIS